MGFLGMIVGGFLLMEKLFGGGSFPWWWVVVPPVLGWAFTLSWIAFDKARGKL